MSKVVLSLIVIILLSGCSSVSKKSAVCPFSSKMCKQQAHWVQAGKSAPKICQNAKICFDNSDVE